MKSATQIEYRSCRESDIPAVLELWSSSTVGGSTNTFEAIRTRLTRGSDLFILAFDGSRLIASLMGGWDGWRTSMARLAVVPEYRRKGIASRLVTMVEERLISKGASGSMQPA
jgi:ribosomal protein S18 acetylase RimI-like enzyme